MKRVTGIGGIFFKAKDAAGLQAWYQRHLGIDVQAWVAPLSRGPTDKANPSQEQRSGPSVQRKPNHLGLVARRS